MTLSADLRQAVRLLKRSPGFAATSVLVLSLAIGVNTAIFSLVDAVVLKPLPYQDPQRLVMVYEDARKQGYPHLEPAVANFVDWRNQSQTLVNSAAFTWYTYSLTGVDAPQKVEGQRVTASLFAALGVQPFLGTVFSASEEHVGAPDVAVISYGLWQRRFGRDRDLVGKTITLDGRRFTVVGVMPPAFRFPSKNVELWTPLRLPPDLARNRVAHFIGVVARLKPGLTLAEAQTEMDLIANRLEKEFPVYNTGIGITLVPLAEQLTSGVKPTLVVLTMGVGLVLLIGCVNIANLMLARGAARQREMAVRTALGARRSQLVWQLLIESWVLSAVAGGFGFLLAMWGASLLNTFVPNELGHIGAVAVSWRAFLFCFVLSMSSALAFGTVPALHGSRLELNTAMAKSTRTVAASRSQAQAILLLSEVSLSVMLLVGSALMIRSYVNLLKVDLGFQQGDVLTLRVVPPASKYGALPARAAFYERVLENIRSLPGVIAAGMTSFLPLSLQGGTEGIAIEGHRVANDHLPAPSYRVVTPDYFRTLGIPLRKGRWLQASDNERAPLAAAINEKLARRYWPNEDALGKRFRIDDPRQTTPWITVIGVVGDVRQWAVDQEPRPELYIPYRQRPEYGYRPQDLVIRTTSDPMQLVPAVRRAIWDIDRDQPIGDIATMEQVLASELAPRRLQTILLSLFAVGAFALATLGVYGVVSYTVAQRTREIGIRIALGASRTDVTRLFVRRGMLLVAAATLIGILASFAIWRVLRTFLFEVSSADLTSLAGVTVLVGTAALLAHYVPARRASRLDPMVTLREE